MKRMILAAILFAATTGIQAQPPQGKKAPMSKEEMISHRIERLDKELKLTDKQKKKIQAILADELKDMPSQEQMKAKREEMKAKREEMEAKHKEMRAKREATDKKIEDVLTAEQKTKYAELKKHQHHGGKGHGRPGRPHGQKPAKEQQDGCCKQ